MALSGSFSGSIRNGGYKLRVDWSATQNVANNTSKITCAMYLVQGSGYSLAVGSRSDNTTVINGASRTWTSPAINNGGNKTTKMATVTGNDIAHDAEGKKTVTISATYYIRATIAGTYTEKITATATVTLDDIPRATTPYFSDDDGNEIAEAYISDGTDITTIQIRTPRASTTFTHKLMYSFAGGPYFLLAENVERGYAWTLPESLNERIPNALSGTLMVSCTTYNASGQSIGVTTVSMTLKVSLSVGPSWAIQLEDEHHFADNAGMYIQGKSRIHATVVASGRYGATITYKRFYTNNEMFDTLEWTTKALQKVGDQKIDIRIKDSRGRQVETSSPYTVVPYSAPKVTALAATRVDADGNESADGLYARVRYSYEVSSLEGKNSASVLIYYRQRGTETWNGPYLTGDTALSAQNVTRQLPYELSTDNEWEIKVLVGDRLLEDNGEYIVTLPTGSALMDFDFENEAVAIGMVAQKANTFQVAKNTELLAPTAQIGNMYSAASGDSNFTDTGFDLVARVTVLQSAAYGVVSFTVANLYATTPMTLHLRLMNTGSTDTYVSSFTYEGDWLGAYVAKNGAEWNIYVARHSAYDRPTVQEWHTSRIMEPRVSVSFPMDFVTDLPLGYVKATPAKLRSVLDFLYPVGSIYLCYNHVHPQGLFPGSTWERITTGLLRAVGDGTTIGSTGSVADGSGRTYVNIAAWRRLT